MKSVCYSMYVVCHTMYFVFLALLRFVNSNSHSGSPRVKIFGEVPREEKILYAATDSESYITEYTSVCEKKLAEDEPGFG